MSIRQTTGANTNPQGSDIDPDFHIASCTVEDVDRALFNLFEKDLNLFYELKDNIKKIPVIFATGERFAVLRRKKPLRDKAGALVLPLVSIMRSGVEQNNTKGAATNQNTDITIKRRLSPADPAYQRLVNKEALRNQDDRATPAHYITTIAGGVGGDGQGTLPGTVAVRNPKTVTKQDYRLGKLITNRVKNNIFEIYTIPAPKYFTATYEITFWAQYTQQMNDMITSVVSSYHSNSGKCFRIESDKGYYFVAYFGESLSPGNNFDDFTDDERLVRYSFSVEVPGYIVNPKYPGSLPSHRRYISAPQITFDTTHISAVPEMSRIEGVPSGNPSDYILQDVETMDFPLPSQTVGNIEAFAAGAKYYNTTNVGGQSAGRSRLKVKRVFTDINGNVQKQELSIVGENQRQGETVYREQITYDLGNLVIEPK
jgi:hypothetical protein